MRNTRAWQKFTLTGESPVSTQFLSFQIVIEPRRQAFHYVAPVFGLEKFVSLTRIDYELRFDAQGLERVPELAGLRHWTFAVVLPDQHQSGCLHVLYEGNG